jgi:hypothetical protein
MTFSSGGNKQGDKESAASPFQSEQLGAPAPKIVAFEVPADEESHPFPNEFRSEAPAPVAKLVARVAPEKIRLPILPPPEPPTLRLSIETALASADIDWRNVLVGVLAAVVIMQAMFIAFWRTSSGFSVPPATGSITVTSSPSGSPVTIDGAISGTTPLTLPLAAGSHRIEVGSGQSLRVQNLSVTGGANSVLHVDMGPSTTVAAAAGPAASSDARGARPAANREARKVVPPSATGWLTISSTVPMQVYEDGALVGTSEMSRILLRAGRHELTLVNDALGYRITRTLRISPDETTSVELTPPMGMLSINASPWAEVFINGQRAGETPIGNYPLPIGQHEVLFRHPDLGEQRKTVTVGVEGPVRVGVDMKTPP